MTSIESDLQDIRDKLARHSAQALDLDVSRQAAVSLILRQAKSGVEMMFIQRATSEADPWSGQIAFPGGGKEVFDRDLVEAAVRETLEETAVQLDRNLLATHLMDQQGSNRGGTINLLIRCFVFQVSGAVHPIANYEVAEVFWMPVSYLQNRVNTITFQPEITRVPAEGIDLGPGSVGQSRILWGLTYRFVQHFLTLIEEN